MSIKNKKLRCDWCGCFVSIEDITNNKARHQLVLPDSHYSQETYETICEKCLKTEK